MRIAYFLGNAHAIEASLAQHRLQVRVLKLLISKKI